MIDVIEDIKAQIVDIKKYNQNMDGKSWGYEDGVLISGNQAQKIVDAFKGLVNWEQEFASLLSICNNPEMIKNRKTWIKKIREFNALWANSHVSRS